MRRSAYRRSPIHGWIINCTLAAVEPWITLDLICRSWVSERGNISVGAALLLSGCSILAWLPAMCILRSGPWSMIGIVPLLTRVWGAFIHPMLIWTFILAPCISVPVAFVTTVLMKVTFSLFENDGDVSCN